MTEHNAGKTESPWPGRINRVTALVAATAGLVEAVRALLGAVGG
jgi:hypothetical protein